MSSACVQPVATLAERERLERQAAERREKERRERAEREREERAREHERAERERAALLVAGPPEERLPGDRARHVVQAAFAAGLPVRSAVELTGWSVGWVNSRYQELRVLTSTARPVLEGVAS
ncbi:hypothetical protein ACM614_23610 [Streptomyces sp. 12297]